MNKRKANKILNTTNYYEIIRNLENGKVCFVPKTSKHVFLMHKACEILKDMSPYNDMNKSALEAFEVED